ncbi:MAG: hypothetical protein KAI29_05440, partial [Cyclobacteriaceae bacterium]|nr:hypothetical protein [Cyclobacteriaceae bacterium]
MLSFRSLSLKITVSILFAVFLIFSAIILYNYFISRDLLLKNVESNVKSLGESKALKIENMLGLSEKIPQNLSYILESTEYSIEDLKEFLRYNVEKNEEIFGSCIAFEPRAFDPDSNYFAPYTYRHDSGVAFKYLNSESMNYFGQDWYKIPKESLNASWTQPYFDEDGGNILMCTYSVPFYASSEERIFKGVATIDISLEYLKDFVESIKIYDNGYAFLISDEGTVITHPIKDSDANDNIFQIAEERDYDVLRRVAEDMMVGGSDFIPYDSPLIEGDTWLFYTPVMSSGWSLAIILPEEEFMSDLYVLNRDLLIIA